MLTNNKISIRFFDDKEVRAIWDEENAKWWFNVVDIVSVLNEQDDYTKANNYWRWFKRKLIKEQNQLVSATHGFKFLAPDGKKRLADTLDSNGIVELAKQFPNKIKKFTNSSEWETENPQENYHKLYKQITSFNKHLGKRYDYMSGSHYFMTVWGLFYDDVLTTEDISRFDIEVQNELLRLKSAYENE